MVVALFSTPSAFGSWALHLLNLIVSRLKGDTQIIPVVFLADLRAAWKERADRAVIIFSDIPETPLSELVLNARAPMVVVYDDAMTTLRYAMVARQIDLRQGIRFVTQSYATLEPACLANGSTLFGPQARRQRLTHFIAQFAAAYHLEMTDMQCAAVAEEMRQGQGDDDETVGMNIERHLPLAQPDALPRLRDDEADLARSALAQYEQVTHRRSIGPVNIPPGLMNDWDRLGNAYLEGPLDLTGPRRILTAGHMIHLPVGTWRGTIEVEVTENLSGNELATDFLLGDRSLAGVIAPLPKEGQFGFSIDFAVEDAFPPLQLRIVLREGAIEGQLAISQVTLERLG